MESVTSRGDCSVVAHQYPIIQPNWTAFGLAIRRLRLEAGLTQEALAHEVGISSNYLSDVERGRRNITINLLFALADGLDIAGDDLFAHFRIDNRISSDLEPDR